jgi:MFS family permease
MPYEPDVVRAVDGTLPDDTLHVLISPDTVLPFLSDIVPVGLVHGVYSAGDLLIAFGGFLIPFVLLQPRAEPANRQLRSTNFAFFWLAQAVSRFGDPITTIALVYVSYRLTESALLSAVALGLGIAANAIFGFIGGAVGDAIGPRRAMFWCDVVRTALVGLIPILLVFHAPLFFVFTLAFLAGIGAAIFNPARGALVPALLTSDRLAAGNSLVFATDRAVEIGGQLAGAALVLVLGDGAFYVDALTFALSAVLLARVVVNEPVRAISWTGLRHDAADGLRFIRDNVVVRANTLFSFAAQFANPVVNTLTPAFLIRRFANNDALSGAVLFAGAEAAIALGAVLGSAILPRYLERVPKGRSLLIGFGVTGATIIAISVSPAYAIAVALFALLGFVNVLSFVPTVTILQQATPQALIGRVFGARITLTNLTWLVIFVFGALVAEQIGVEVVLAFAGLVTLVTAVIAAFVPAIRDVP